MNMNLPFGEAVLCTLQSLNPIRRRSFTFSAVSFSVAAGAAVGSVLIAWAIAEGYWRSLALLSVVAAIPLALVWPVVLAFGAYTFAIPFDSINLAGGSTI